MLMLLPTRTTPPYTRPQAFHADQSIISECGDNSSEDTFKNAEVLLNHNEKLNWNQIQRDDPDICYTIEHIVEGTNLYGCEQWRLVLSKNVLYTKVVL